MNEKPDTAKRTLLRSAAQIVAGSVAGLSHAQPIKDKPRASSRTAWVYDEAYLTPVFEPSHPERPQRVQAMAKAIRDHALNSQLDLLKPQSVQAFEVDEAIKLIHTQTHIDSLRAQYSATIIDLARLAVAGCMLAADAVMAERVRNVFVCSRPPGHHARNTGREEGFCFFNHVAIAARYLQKRHGVQRVLIVDWDYHHGDGTEHFFYEDGSVMLFNTYDPLSCGTDDNQIRRVFEQQLVPAANRFKPDFILISAGFDSRANDLLGCFQISDEGFVSLTKIVMDLAERHCKGRVVSVLEGGYNLAGLASVALAHVGTLANYQTK
jgi:acetoin utilization deacetylase AcuC-like enzyme